MAARIQIVLTQNSQNIAGNYSSVTASVYYYGNGGSYNYENPAGQLVLNGVNYSWNHNFTTSESAQLMYSTTVNIPHNPDGTKTLTASATFVTETSAGTLTTSESKVLTTIPRASSVSASSSTVTYGQDVIFTITPASNEFTHTIQAGVTGHLSYTDIATNVGTSYTWTLPVEYAQYMPDNNPLLIRVLTYSGSTQIGSSVITLTPVPTTSDPDMRPAVSLTVTDPEGYYTTWGGFVQNRSKISVQATETFYANTTGKTRSLSVNGVTYNSNSAVSEVIISPNAQTVTYSVTDGRGLSANASESINVIPWYAPKLEGTRVFRSDSTGNEDEEGEWITVDLTYNFASVNSQNEGSVLIKYKDQSSSTYTEIPLLPTGYGPINVIETFAASGSQRFDVTIELNDSLNGSASMTYQIGTAFVLVDFHNSGTGVAMGKSAESGNLLDINLPSQFRQDLYIGDSSDNNLLKLGNFSSNSIAEWAAATGEATPSLEGILGKLSSSYVVEEYDETSDQTSTNNHVNWVVQKWSDGRITAQGRRDLGNIASDGSALGGYFKVVTFNLPRNMIYPRFASPQITWGTGVFLSSCRSLTNTGDANNTVSCNVLSSQNGGNMYVYIYAEGRWKSN